MLKLKKKNKQSREIQFVFCFTYNNASVDQCATEHGSLHMRVSVSAGISNSVHEPG